jgi:hypothetical protein
MRLPFLVKAERSCCAAVSFFLSARVRSGIHPHGLPPASARAGRRVKSRRAAWSSGHSSAAFVVADGGEVATDAAAEGEGGALGFGGVLGDRFVGAGDDALEGGDLVVNDGAERAGFAERALDEGREALEVTGDAVAPAALAGDAGLLLAVALAVDGAEDVGRGALEVVAVDDELVVGVDLGELAAAAAPEEQVHHDVGAGDEVAAAGGLAREAKGGREVVAQEQLLADAAVAVAGEEAGGDEEDAEAARGEQVEGAAHEVDVGAVFFVEGVGVLEGCGAAFAVGRVADDEVECALLAAAGVGDPALERHRVELDVGADGAEELAADARELDGGPAQGERLARCPAAGRSAGPRRRGRGGRCRRSARGLARHP